MHEIKCIICGNTILTNQKYQNTCSDECRVIKKKKNSKENHGTITRVCVVCNNVYELHGFNNNSKYCSSVCQSIGRNNIRKARYKEDIQYKLNRRLHNYTYKHIVKECKQNSPIELIGCTMDYLKKYISNKFTEGMTWKNHGSGKDKWHIDHIKPCASFNLIDIQQQKECFHYSNLQPLWEPDNLRKGAKI